MERNWIGNLRGKNSTRIERKCSRRRRCPPKKKKYGSLTVHNREENKLEAKGFNTVECG